MQVPLAPSESRSRILAVSAMRRTFRLRFWMSPMPHDIHLDNSTVEEDQAVGTHADDADLGDSHTYRLVSGSGATHNELFRVEDNRLLTHDLLDYEQNASLSTSSSHRPNSHRPSRTSTLSAVRKPMAGGHWLPAGERCECRGCCGSGLPVCRLGRRCFWSFCSNVCSLGR